MHRRTLIAALPLVALPATAQAHPITVAEVSRSIDEVKAFREKHAKAIEAKDFSSLRRSYADSYTHTHGSGKFDNKDARIVSAMAGEPLVEGAPATDLVFRAFAGPTVIVTGKSPILNLKEQKSYDFRWVCVYVTTDGEWQLGVSQATRLS